MRVFLDANVLFSAAKSSGAVRQFLHKLKSLGHTLVTDGYVTSEAGRNLEVKFPSAVEDFEKVLEAVKTSATASKPLGIEVAPGLPEKDRPVLAAAIQHRCQVLLTGDKAHFGPLYGQTLEGLVIHSPASFAATLRTL